MDEKASRMTPYNDRYRTCERTLAKLRIYPGELGPDEVTLRLGVHPTSTQTKGERHVNSIGRERVAKINGWFLSSEEKVKSLDIRRHLDWLLDIIEPSAQALKVLQRTLGVVMTIDCIWWSRYAQGGPTLWPEQMRRMADLNLECGFDISFFGDDEDDSPDTSNPTIKS